MKDHNEYLKLAQTYLVDLPVMETSKILSMINDEILELDSTELPDALTYVNKKRVELGHYPFKYRPKPSFLRFFLKLTAVMSLISFAAVGILVWKFTPLFKLDEANNRVIILGGLIDIDGQAGKLKIGNDYQFTEAKYENEFQGSFMLDQNKDEVLIKFTSGAFKVSTSLTDEVSVKCKLETPPKKDMIVQADDIVTINFTDMQGSSCDIAVPQEKKITLEGVDANIELIQPEFNAYIEIENGNFKQFPTPEIDYNYQVKVGNGHTGEFQNSLNIDAYEIKVTIANGSAISN